MLDHRCCLVWNFPLSLSIPRRVSNLNWLFNCCQSWGNALWFPLLIQISTLFFSARANKFLSHKSIAQYHEYKLCFNIFWIINRTFHLKRFGYSSMQMRNPIMQRCLTIQIIFSISVLQPVRQLLVQRSVHRHERPAPGLPLQHLLLLTRQLQGGPSLEL